MCPDPRHFPGTLRHPGQSDKSQDIQTLDDLLMLRLKLDTAQAFQTWITWAEKQMSHSLLQVCSDRGGEFLANTFHMFLRSKGTEHQLSVADHPQQNGRAERFNHTLLEKEETMHYESK